MTVTKLKHKLLEEKYKDSLGFKIVFYKDGHECFVFGDEDNGHAVIDGEIQGEGYLYGILMGTIKYNRREDVLFWYRDLNGIGKHINCGGKPDYDGEWNE